MRACSRAQTLRSRISQMKRFKIVSPESTIGLCYHAGCLVEHDLEKHTGTVLAGHGLAPLGSAGMKNRPGSARPSRFVHDRSRIGTLDSPGQMGTRANHSFPNLHEAFRFCALFTRPDRQVGRGNGSGTLLDRRIEVADAWVAATALLYDAPLITNNPGDYVGVAGIKLLPNE